MRCGACRRAFRLPAALPAPAEEPAEQASPSLGPEWSRVQAGLGLMFYGGWAVFISLVLTVAVWVTFSLTAGEELRHRMGNPNQLQPEQMLVALSVCGVGLVGLLALIPVLIGCGVSLGVPAETGARGSLALCISCALVAALLVLAAILTLMPIALQLQAQPEAMLPEGALTLPGIFLLVAIVVGVAACVAHGRFLLRLALYLREGAIAWNATKYLLSLLLLCSVGVLALCIANFFGLFIPRGGTVVRLILFLFVSLLFGRWLGLLRDLRSTIGQRLSAPASSR